VVECHVIISTRQWQDMQKEYAGNRKLLEAETKVTQYPGFISLLTRSPSFFLHTFPPVVPLVHISWRGHRVLLRPTL